MSETFPSVQEPSAEDLAAKKEMLAAKLQETAFMLAVWYNSRESDSVERQELRKREYSQASEMLRTVSGDAFGLRQQIQLTTARDAEPLVTRRMDTNAYDFTSDSPDGQLEPGQTRVLDWEKRLVDYIHKSSRSFYYIGDLRYLEVADIAQALGSGGTLELVDKPSDAEPIAA